MREGEPGDMQVHDEEPSRITEDFDALLAERQALREKKKFSTKEVDAMLGLLMKSYGGTTAKKDQRYYEKIDQRLEPLLESTVKKIGAQLGDVVNFEQLARALDLLDVEKSAEFTKINLKHPKKAKTQAYYGDGKIVIDLAKVDNSALLIFSELAADGNDSSTGTFHHEYIHALQYQDDTSGEERAVSANSPKRKLVPDPRTGNDTFLLREVQAFRGEERYMKRRSAGNLLRMMRHHKAYGMKTTANNDRVLTAGQDIKRLYALGLTDEHIAKLTKESTWDNERKGFDTLLNKIEELMRKKGLEEEDVDNLVLADDLKRDIYVEKVRLIAQEELEKAYNEALQQGEKAA